MVHDNTHQIALTMVSQLLTQIDGLNQQIDHLKDEIKSMADATREQSALPQTSAAQEMLLNRG